MGLTERHWFEDEEPTLTDRQLEDIVYENKKAYDSGYVKGFHDAKALEKNQITNGEWKFIFYNPNYSPFDGSPDKIYKCTNCGYTTGSTTEYCPMCGCKNKSQPE